MPLPDRLRSSRWQVLLDSLVSWFTYDPRSLPGLLQSPVGSKAHRAGLTVLATVLAAVVLVRWPNSPLPQLLTQAHEQHQTITQELDARGASRLEQLRYASLTWLLAFLAIGSLPIVVPWTLTLSATMPVLLEAAAERDQAARTEGAQAVLTDLRHSPDPAARDSIYLGRVAADGSPVLVPRLVFCEHAHGLGDSGSGKTSLFLCPIIEQLIMPAKCGVVGLNLKADTLELLAAMESSAEAVRRDLGVCIPVKTFSNQADQATFAFNPMRQPYWPKFDLLTRTDIRCAASGLTYGTDYGQGYYSSANAAILYHALKSFPHVDTFTELADCIGPRRQV